MKFILATGCVLAFVSLGAGDLPAQSLSGIVSQTGHVLSKTVRSAQRALSKSSGNRNRSETNRRGHGKDSGHMDLAKAPPVPVRRPRSWIKTTPQAARPLKKSSPARFARQPEPQPALKHGRKLDLQRGKSKRFTTPVVKDAGAPKEDPAKPVADVWSEVELNVARARCHHLLKQVDAVTIAQPAIKKGPCGDPAPVKLVSIGSSPQVAVSPPAVVNCQMVHALYGWLENNLQPLSQKHLGAKIVTIETMSSYSCRNAYGRKDTRLSEHARANALDIGGFLMSNGKHTRLLADWGPNKRDIAAAKKKAREKARLAAQEAAKIKAAKASSKSSVSGMVTKTVSTRASASPRVRGTIVEGLGEQASDRQGSAKKSTLGAGPARLGGPKSKQRTSKTSSARLRAGLDKKKRKDKDDVTAAIEPYPIPRISNTRQAKFLRAAHRSACALFGTVLGPDANEAHRNHFHVDLAPRKHGNYCR